MKTLLFTLSMFLIVSFAKAQTLSDDATAYGVYKLEPGTIVGTPDKYPIFPVGSHNTPRESVDSLKSYILKNIKYDFPKYLFIVAKFEKDGSISYATLSNNDVPHDIRIKLNKLIGQTKWDPAMQNGQPARLYWMFPPISLANSN